MLLGQRARCVRRTLKMFASAIIVVVGALVMEVLPSILTAWERCAIWRPCVRIRMLSKRVMLLPHPAWVGETVVSSSSSRRAACRSTPLHLPSLTAAAHLRPSP